MICPVLNCFPCKPWLQVGWMMCRTRLRYWHWGWEVVLKIKNSVPPKITVPSSMKKRTWTPPTIRKIELISGKSAQMLLQENQRNSISFILFFAVGTNPHVALPHPEPCWFSSEGCYMLTSSKYITLMFICLLWQW